MPSISTSNSEPKKRLHFCNKFSNTTLSWALTQDPKYNLGVFRKVKVCFLPINFSCLNWICFPQSPHVTRWSEQRSLIELWNSHCWPQHCSWMSSRRDLEKPRLQCSVSRTTEGNEWISSLMLQYETNWGGAGRLKKNVAEFKQWQILGRVSTNDFKEGTIEVNENDQPKSF